MVKKYFDEYRVKLERKMKRVLEMIPEVQTLGMEKDESGELIPYTAAEDIRELYFAALKELRLSVRPVASPDMKPDVVFSPNGRQFAVAGCYEICDKETGYVITGWGVGVGDNGHWAANTAQTKAMKQFLLASFMANWKDPTRLSCKEKIEQFGEQAEIILSVMKKRKSVSDEIMERLMPTGKSKKKAKKKTKKRKAGTKHGRTHKKPNAGGGKNAGKRISTRKKATSRKSAGGNKKRRKSSK